MSVFKGASPPKVAKAFKKGKENGKTPKVITSNGSGEGKRTGRKCQC